MNLSTTALPIQNGYFLDGYICSQNNKNNCQAVNVRMEYISPEIDSSMLAQYWTVGFTTVLFLWLFSVGVGQVIKLVRNA
ncbi:hypothetical protein D5073_20370 [Pectobacterium versatile]|uniref:hypothetical protein n=1 Tax=Pectobacterium TaxID=122277 RepID=UPI000B7BDED6|nr:MULTISPECIES: hypothetical protein [Pectobacterium]ASN85715.1 Hypothetical protein SCC1_2282 [Pectobacterium versatile]MBQ4765330.1 hypothetical protein [Pectobacterium versatile]POE23474.1 hypothetical protein BV923_05755 [Pectobacterium odoriferum]RJL49151.1 hypothetical protein D5073_20370 [Pectobacterium versatile]RJL52606.1 hypothetical protein D5076_20580 [Pectobacterium versatile]